MSDRHSCRWGCGYRHPVASMVDDHKAGCEVWQVVAPATDQPEGNAAP